MLAVQPSFRRPFCNSSRCIAEFVKHIPWKGRCIGFLLLLAFTLAGGSPNVVRSSLAADGPISVRVVRDRDRFQLERGGKPYLIRGVGGKDQLDLLAKVGGNSIRTWSVERLEPLLDEAQRLGLTVTVGLWLGHERHGFNYNDVSQVARQADSVREAVLKYKDHPAVLAWGIGNEMEGPTGDNAAIWLAIEQLAVMVKQLDPQHPTMTVIAEIGGEKVPNLHRLCPSIDIVGINSYGGIATLDKRYREAGGKKPYVVTEFGPPGMWEVTKTEWGAPPELTSTQKAVAYRNGYEKTVRGAAGSCLGSYAFLWGHKQEATATWFGLLLPDGRRTEAVDVLQELWSSKKPANGCPRIDQLKVVGPVQLDPEGIVRATLATSDPDGDSLKVQWVLQAEASAYGSGGDAEEIPPTFPESIVRSYEKGVEVKLPKSGGGYRLFAYVDDGHGGAAVGNIALFVKGPRATPMARKASLPLVIYDEADRPGAPYVPSGWMGNQKGLRVDEKSTTNPHSGKTCIRVEYREPSNWAGVVWQSPANDWGDRPGGWNWEGAKRVTFWARGAAGGETVKFDLGLYGREKAFYDTGKGSTGPVTLTQEWTRLTIDLQGQDLTRIKSGFAFALEAKGKAVEFFLDDIQVE